MTVLLRTGPAQLRRPGRWLFTCRGFRVIMNVPMNGQSRSRPLASQRLWTSILESSALQPMHPVHQDITLLLHAAASGDRESVDALMTAIYQDMRRLAAHHMGAERRDHTLQPTAVVHEAYVRLIDQRKTDWKDRLHFFAVASRIIRRVLIDHARANEAGKRGGDRTRISLEDHEVAGPARDIDLMALDEALNELAEIDPQQCRIVELRYFGGCTVEEVAELLGVGKRTVDRDWQAAKAWLFLRLEEGEADGTQDSGEEPS